MKSRSKKLLELKNLRIVDYSLYAGHFRLNHHLHRLVLTINALKNLTELLDILNPYYITPTIKEPTRLTDCLDNICVNFEDILFDSRVLNSAIADHHIQVLSMILDTPSNEKAVHCVAYKCGTPLVTRKSRFFSCVRRPS